ncbi:MAG: NAD(P)/FAD-dependent oxidoreductase, partial [Thermoanaerobaculia bacterium]
MPRTPLFRLLGRALREAQAANHLGMSSSEMVDGRRVHRVDRREFLAVTAAATAGLALSGCKTAAPVEPPADEGDPVLIVGAGIAGLTAAYRLGQKGIPARVIEAQSRVGGRMYSIRNFFADGQVAELGGELIDTNHTEIRNLAAELGIALDDLSLESPGIHADIFYFDGAVRTEEEVVEAFQPIAAMIERDLATLTGDDVTYRAPSNAEALDRRTIAQWLDQNGVSGWIRTLLDVGYTTEFGLELDEQSSLNLLTMIDTNPDPFHIFGESDERFHTHDGNDTIPTALARRLERDVETNTFLESLSERADGSFLASVRRNGSSTTIRAPQVVLAIPFTILRDVRIDVELPPAKEAAIATLGYGTNAKVMVGFERRVWRDEYGSNGSVLTDLAFQLSWETSRKQEGRSGILTNFTGGRHGVEVGEGTDAEQARKFAEDLDRVFPGIAAARGDSKAVRFHWPTFRLTRGSYATYRPGQWTTLRGAEGEAVRNLFFAGEHCSLEFQGFMQGGCETGEAAARAVAA